MRVFVAIALAVILVVISMFASCTRVNMGYRVVTYNKFSKQFGAVLEPGISFVNPLVWTKKAFDIRTQEYTMSAKSGEGTVKGDDSISALSSDGLSLGLDITIQYSLSDKKDDLQNLYSTVSRDYLNTLIRPKAREAIRSKFASYEANESYSIKRDEIQAKIFDEVSSALKPRGIIVESVLIRNVILPSSIREAIDAKKVAEQASERMKYELQIAEQNKKKVEIEASASAERQRIEAEGNAKAIALIQDALSRNPMYLRWFAIDRLNGNVKIIMTPDGVVPMIQMGDENSK